MIVRYASDRILLITQPDHAHLARRIMEHCAPLAERPRRDTILHAIAEHDNGWAEEDDAPRMDPASGQILDFINAPAAVRQDVWPRGVTRLAGEPLAAALVAQHALVIYDRHRSDGEWTPFFTEIERLRNAMLEAAGQPLADLMSDYVFVRLADLISLVFCMGSTDDVRIDRWTVRPSGTRVTVTPDAFAGAEIPVEIVAREIPRRSFRSDAELREAVRRAGTVTLRGTVSASTTPRGSGGG